MALIVLGRGLFGVDEAISQRSIDEEGELASGGRDGLGLADSGGEPPVEGAEGVVAATDAHGDYPEDLGRSVGGGLGLRREDIAISQVMVAEIEFGLRYLPSSKRRRLLREQWAAIGLELIRLPWDDRVSLAFGARKARLENAGNRMSDFDLAIAAHAIAFGLIVVTADKAFERLRVRWENWLR